MANTKEYLSHLLQNTGITPACSEEERAAAEVIAKVFDDHGFTPEIQEFSASGSVKVVQAGLGIVLFVGAVLVGIGGVAGIIGVLLTIAAAVIFTMERMGRPVLSQLGSGGLSQNVVAYHKASGPLASPRNRPVVVVAHYDSPRVDLLSKQPFAAYRPILVKLLPFAMVAPALIAIVRRRQDRLVDYRDSVLSHSAGKRRRHHRQSIRASVHHGCSVQYVLRRRHAGRHGCGCPL